MFVASYVQGSTAADHCICDAGTSCLIGRGKTRFRICIQAVQHTDFILKASASYHAHNTVYSDELLWFPQSLNKPHPPYMSLKISRLIIFVYFNNFFNCISYRSLVSSGSLSANNELERIRKAKRAYFKVPSQHLPEARK